MFRRLRSYARTARNSLRYEGMSILAWRVVVKAVSPVFDLALQILFEIDLRQPIPQREARVACVIEQASLADLDELVAARYPPPPPLPERELTDAEEYDRSVYLRQNAHLAKVFRDSITTWFEAGELCFVARVQGRIAHSNWIRFHGCAPVGNTTIHLLPAEVYTTEGFTSEPLRGLGLHEAVLSQMLRYAQSRGCKLAYTITDLTKAGARRGVRRVGWRQRGHHLFITAGWLRRTWVIRLGGDVEPILRDVLDEEASAR